MPARPWLLARPSAARLTRAPLSLARPMPQAAPTTDVATRKIYVGNIPRTVTNDELRSMFAEHDTVVLAEDLEGQPIRVNRA